VGSRSMNSLVLSLAAKRVVVAFATLLFVAFTIFFATEMLPGDVAEILLGQAATPEAVAGLRTAMNLDQPAFLRFIYWLGNLFTGDFGVSYVNKMPISELIGGRLVNSLKLAGVTAVISVPVALTLGITAAILRGTLYDRIVSIFTISVIGRDRRRHRLRGLSRLAARAFHGQ
jgi:peptide/nickel transport system permease protein